MKVWIYTNTSKQVGDAEHVKVFANEDAAHAWFTENDPEGVAFGYEVIGDFKEEELSPLRPAGSADKYGVPKAEE